MLRRAATIICSSDFVRLDFLKEYSARSVTITPGVDCAAFTPATQLPPEPIVLFVAGMDRGQEYKGLKTLLEAIAILDEEMPDLQLVAVGDGDLRHDYEDYARALGVGKRVEFRGRLAGEELAQSYRSARVFALPTSKDSHPLVLLEAMASGLPIVSTTTGGIPDMICDGREGCLIAPRNAALLAEKIELLLTDDRLAATLAGAARKRAQQEFSWESRAANYDRILRQAVAAPRPGKLFPKAYTSFRK